MVADKPTEPKPLPGRAAKARHSLIRVGSSKLSPRFAAPQKKRAKIVRFTTDDFTWQCWQCLSAFSSNVDLVEHLKSCDSRNAGEGEVILAIGDSLPGCPFCPRDGCQAESKPYYFQDFDTHVETHHSNVKELSCPYCTVKIASHRLEALTSHILTDHQIHWRPSPASMVYQRIDDVVHRVVTCLGCGWCTFVLRAQDAVQPPASLASHMSRCAGRGGRISVPRLPPTPRRSTKKLARTFVNELTTQSTLAGDAFATRFPTVRGFASPLTSSSTDGEAVTVKRLKYQSPLKKVSPPVLSPPSPLPPVSPALPPEAKPPTPEKPPKEEPEQPPKPESSLTNGDSLGDELEPASTSSEPQPPHQKKPKSASIASSSATPRRQFVPPGVFDVPLDLPPSPPKPASGGSTPSDKSASKKTGVSRVYVCPICGDNALSSLRERDKHLQSEHTGELVFPCQLCGMAYPVYIALRRHAVLKHNANYDAVLYGQPDMDPVECPYCELVAFTSPEVLQLHLAKIHPEQFQQQTVVSAVASALAGDESDDLNDKDWTESGKPPSSAAAASATPVHPSTAISLASGGDKPRRKRGRPRTRPYTPADLLDNPDLLEKVESSLQMRQAIAPGRRGRGRGRGRGGGGGGRGRRPKAAAVLLGAAAPPPPVTVSSHQSADEPSDACTILTDADGRPIDDASAVCSGPALQPPPPNAVSTLEAVLAQTPPEHAPVSCRLCGPEAQIVLDNAKELCIHMELDHNPESDCEQLGCQACGRIFFGPHHRADLIGHFRVAHQLQEAALSCPNHEPVELLSTSGQGEDQLNLTGGGCLAKFTSARLRDSHLIVTDLPGWSCPLQLESETVQAMTVAETVSANPPLDTMVLATEIAADAAGQMVLAYGCPLCSRVFTGENCTARYLAHQSQCSALVAEQPMVVATQETTTAEVPVVGAQPPPTMETQQPPQ